MPFDANDPEVKAAIQAAVDAATAPLVAKRDELLGEVKKLRKSAEISPDQLAAVEAERDKLQADLTAAQKQVKDATKAAETATKQLEAETGFTQKLLVDNGLVSELTKHGVTNPVHLKAAQALLRGNVQIAIDGENRVAKVGDKALADFVKEWASGDEGKHFVAAQQNTGGGAGGGSGGGKGQNTLNRTEFGALAPAAQMAHIKGGGAVVD